MPPNPDDIDTRIDLTEQGYDHHDYDRIPKGDSRAHLYEYANNTIELWRGDDIDLQNAGIWLDNLEKQALATALAEYAWDDADDPTKPDDIVTLSFNIRHRGCGATFTHVETRQEGVGYSMRPHDTISCPYCGERYGNDHPDEWHFEVRIARGDHTD